MSNIYKHLYREKFTFYKYHIQFITTIKHFLRVLT